MRSFKFFGVSALTMHMPIVRAGEYIGHPLLSRGGGADLGRFVGESVRAGLPVSITEGSKIIGPLASFEGANIHPASVFACQKSDGIGNFLWLA